MVRKRAVRRSAGIVLGMAALLLSAPLVAQDSGLGLVQTAEYDIGFDCPVASALDPTGTVIWLLMNNCGESDFALRAYNLADGSQVNEDDYAAALVGLDNVYVDPFITPLAFTPAGDLSIRYNDIETSASFNLLIPLASGGEATTETSAAYDALLARYSDYPEFSAYSPDHTRVVAAGATSFHVLDVQAQSEIVEIPVEGSMESALAIFSADSQRLEITYYNYPDEPDNYAASLLIYSLPAGVLLEQYQLPSPAVWVSPDGAYAAVNLYSNNIGDVNELIVIDLATGSASPASNLNEAAAAVPNCLNNGNDVSDIGFMTSGQFSVPGLHWLPDSSSLVLPLSYGGEGAQGSGSICIFNYSRLRTYEVENAG